VLLSLLATAALAQSTVLALGEGSPADPPAAGDAPAEAADAMPGGWVSVLADCLEERQPRRWSVVDRASGDVDGDLAGLRPTVVVLGLGGRDLALPPVDERALRTRVERRIRELRGAGPAPGLLIVGPVRVDEAARGEEPQPQVLGRSLVDRPQAGQGGLLAPPDPTGGQPQQVDADLGHGAAPRARW